MSRKSTRKDLHLEEDGLVTFFSRGIEYIRGNRERLSYGVVAVAVVVAVIFLVTYHRRTVRAESEEILAQGWVEYQAALQVSPTDGETGDDLEDPRLDRLARAAEAFEQVLSEYGSTRAGMEAQYMLAATRFESGDAEGALEAYQKFSERYPDDHLSRACRFGEAACLSDLDRRGEAIRVLEGLQHQDKAADQALLEIELARLYRLEQNREQALGFYRSAYQRDPDGEWGSQARSWIIRLGGELPEPDEG